MNDEHELYTIARKMRYDLTALQGRVTEILNALGRIELPEGPTRPECPECGITMKGPRTLLEHRYVAHNTVPDPDLEPIL